MQFLPIVAGVAVLILGLYLQQHLQLPPVTIGIAALCMWYAMRVCLKANARLRRQQQQARPGHDS